MQQALECESRISRVVVYARGAVVTRAVELPVSIPPEGCELVVGGVTPLAEPGSVRTNVDGERRVTGVQAPLAWPTAPQPVAADTAAIVAKQREIRRANLRLERVRFRIEHLEGIEQNANLQAPKRRPEQPLPGVNERLGAALETADLVAELLARLDAEERALRRNLEKLNNEMAQLSQQRPSAPQGGPQRQVRVALAPGSEHLRALEISYNVSAARWWPAYAARLSNGGKNAEFAVEAFVAQYTLEDWKDARISLCTADMVSDLTMPELQSLRLGRAQPAKRSGFREPPEGLDALFKSHDEAFGGPGMAPPSDLRLSTSAYTEAPVPQPSMIAYAEPPAESGVVADYDEMVAEDRLEAGAEYEERPARREKEMAKSRGAPKAKKMAAPPAPPASAPMRSMAMADMAFGGAAGMAPPEPEPEPEAGMGDQWLDFDALELAHNNTARRGRLVPVGAGAFSDAWQLQNAIESLGAPSGATDPLYSRGMFDHQFEADGLVEVPSDARPQRVRLLAKPAKSRMALRCVPLEDERVFREVEIENPLEAPLLPGPVDVFMDGALLITSAIQATDRGGAIRFGLGEEQRVRVARNVRAREETKGVFGGKIAMDHDVSLEAASSLAGDIELELVDRIPVSEDKEIVVELLASEPKPERYNQHDRHHHLDGGLRWKLALKAGATAAVKFTYRIGFDKDFELVGGNRRD
jgi:hypothetical protein